MFCQMSLKGMSSGKAAAVVFGLEIGVVSSHLSAPC
jgi:hypothetical protein